MSAFWSAWIMFLVVLNLGITLFLFVWAQRIEIPTQADGTTGHIWAHGVLREGVRRLPVWWVVLSGLMFVCAFAYLVLYPGFGRFGGLLGWTAHGELARDVERNDVRLAPAMQRFRGTAVELLADDTDATRIGHRLFIDNCAACHRRNGEGNRGFPDLSDGDWLYGGDGETLLTSILDGRQGVMPALGSALGSEGSEQVAHYVLSLSGAAHDGRAAKAGAAQFASLCAACHGADGRGNQLVGAPNLADAIWLYGGDLDSIRTTLKYGRHGHMPAWRGRLTEDEARLIAAWVFSNAQTAQTSQAGASD